MSDKETKKYAPPSPPSFKAGEPVAVKTLQLDKLKNQTGLPGKLAGDGILCDWSPDAPTNRKRWLAHYLPQIRHFVVYYYDVGATEPTQTVAYHETNVVRWEWV